MLQINQWKSPRRVASALNFPSVSRFNGTHVFPIFREWEKFLDRHRSFHAQGGFIRPFAAKNAGSRAAWNENYGIIYLQASCSGCYISYDEKIPFHGGEILKRAINSCVWDVPRTWNGSRGKIFNTPPSPSEFPIQLRSARICSFLRRATLHSTSFIKDEINGIIFSSSSIRCFDLTFFLFSFSFLPLNRGIRK